MNDKKNIDRFFQEKFKDFESEPNEKIWKNIQSSLQNKKIQRRTLPFWRPLVGAAAVLIIGIFAVNNYNEENKMENNVVIEDKIAKPATGNKGLNIEKTSERANKNKTNPKNRQDIVVRQQDKDIQNKVILKANKIPNYNIKNTDQIVEEKENNLLKTKQALFKKSKKLENLNHSIRKNQIAGKASGNNLKYIKERKQFYASNRFKKQQPHSQSKNENNNSVHLSTNQLSDTKINNENLLTNQIVQQENLLKNNLLTEKIAVEQIGDKKSETIAKTETATNALEELLKTKEEEKKKIPKSKLDKWQVTSNVAPIYFSSTANGSPIDAEFAQNKKTYNNNLSLGLGVNYAINKKIKIRSGVNKLTLGYSTKDVLFQTGLSAKKINNISSSGNYSPITIANSNNTSLELMAFEKNIDSFNEGQINQTMGYFEIPLEMSYAIVDKKFGINLIGGLSTLFLTENTISVSSGNMSADLGKANNLSNVHFSTNFGLGFKYKFFKTFEAKLEPTLKYQINTFSNDAGGFRPYFIGLYSGLSWSF